MEVLKSKRILALVGLICLFLGVVMPYFQISIFGYSYEIKLLNFWEGKVMLVLIAANVIFIFRDYIKKYVPQLFNTSLGSKIQNASPKLAIIPTIGVAVFAVWLFISLDVDTTYLKHGLGFWCLWIGVICLVGHTFLYKKDLNTNQSPINYSQMQSSQPTQTNYFQSQSNGEQNIKFCPGCGNKCNLNANRCFMCGRKF